MLSIRFQIIELNQDKAFVPAPEVNAACVTMVPLKEPRIKCNFDVVSKVVKAIFQFKNKKWSIGA